MNTTIPYVNVKRPVATLRIHPLAQRNPGNGLIRAHLKQMTENFDLDAIGTLYAVRATVNGELDDWIIDGWHRIEVLNGLGFGEWEVDVHIYETDDPVRAHQLFLEHNNRAAVNAFDKFINEFGAGEMTAIGVSAIVQRAGYQINASKSANVMACTNSLKTVFRFDHGRSLRKTIATSDGAWGKNEAGHEGRMIEGIGRVFAKNNGAIDERALIQKLAKYSGGPAMMIGAARARVVTGQAPSVARGISRIVVEEYNKGRRLHRIEG